MGTLPRRRQRLFQPGRQTPGQAAGFDETLKLWDAATGPELATLKGHTALVNCACFSPDGKRLASASGDRTVKLWDVATNQDLPHP